MDNVKVFFKWSPAYSVGIQAFDEHHQRLVEIINQLYEAMGQGRGSQEINQIVDQLIKYTQFHFASEEKLLAAQGYAGLAKHRAEHEALKSRVVAFQSSVERGQVGVSVQVASFLKDWLTNHILVEDKQYGVFLQSKGIH